MKGGGEQEGGAEGGRMRTTVRTKRQEKEGYTGGRELEEER